MLVDPIADLPDSSNCQNPSWNAVPPSANAKARLMTDSCYVSVWRPASACLGVGLSKYKHSGKRICDCSDKRGESWTVMHTDYHDCAEAEADPEYLRHRSLTLMEPRVNGDAVRTETDGIFLLYVLPRHMQGTA